jgi:hypothetical protein
VDKFLDQFCEDQISGGYGSILDQLTAEEFDGEPICWECEAVCCCDLCVPYEDDVPLDGDHDSTMTSIGWGCDEDYGFFGGDDER